jgi:dienelactone hydrolase
MKIRSFLTAQTVLLFLVLSNTPARAVFFQPGAAATHVRFDISSPTGAPFPSNAFTVAAPENITGLRINLPLPDCSALPSDCDDLNVVNQLDGFNVQVRLSIPFDGPIDPASVNSRAVFFVQLTQGATGSIGAVVGINQIVWDPQSNTLYAESDDMLEQHTSYALVVTSGVLDPNGQPVRASDEFLHAREKTGMYHRALQEGVRAATRMGVEESRVVAVSVFTTQTVTEILEKIRPQLDSNVAPKASFVLGADGSRTVFALNQIKGIAWNRQTGDNPPSFTQSAVAVSTLDAFAQGAVGRIAFGKYTSPDYMVHPGEYIPTVGTLTGTPKPSGTNQVYFNVFLPSTPAPPTGWPVAILAHGGGNSKDETPYQLAASLASQGIAGIAISAVGRGGGALGTLRVDLTTGPSVTLSSGGRGFDQDGNGTIDAQEGASATPPRSILGQSDAQRQTVVDWMQLVRVIAAGMDVDGDGIPDLDPSRIYYWGTSFGGGLGPQLLALEPRVRAGVFSYPGGAAGRIDIIRLRPSQRGSFTGVALAARTPSLINANGLRLLDGVAVAPPFFNENIPLRDQPPVINDVAGALAIQEVFENAEWVSEAGDAAAYAPYLRKSPLPGVPSKSVLLQVCKGDETGPNPRNMAIVRAGDLTDRTTFYRNDLAYQEDSTVPKDPHSFLGRFTSPGVTGQIGRGGQNQAAAFLASDGTNIIWPDPSRFFEVPISLPLPVDLSFIP